MREASLTRDSFKLLRPRPQRKKGNRIGVVEVYPRPSECRMFYLAVQAAYGSGTGFPFQPCHWP